jgi:hypothetical protein
MSEEPPERPDPLDRLFIDDDEINRELLADVLDGLVQITRKGHMLPRPKYKDLTTKQKIVVYILTCKALAAREMIDSEAVGSTEVSQATDIPRGTVSPYLNQFEDDGLVVNEDGGYYIPNHRLTKAKEFLGTKETTD